MSFSDPRRYTIRNNRSRAFTLVELLVVIGIIALLISILLPSLNQARKSAQKAVCLSNIRQMVQAAVMHANDHKKGVYIPTFGGGFDNIAVLYPTYIEDAQIAVCPGTRNIVRDERDAPSRNSLPDGDPNQNPPRMYPNIVPIDLTQSARWGAEDVRGGHSYEIIAWWLGGVTYPDGQQFPTNNPAGWEQRGISPGEPSYGRPPATGPKYTNLIKSINNVYGQNGSASEVFLILDSDRDDESFPIRPGDNRHANWPDANANHGEEGLNIGFADGHAAFVRTGRELIHTYMKSHNDMGIWNDPYIMSHDPDLKHEGGRLGRYYYE